ncbi:MAG: hypothetical protein JO224_04290 [Pelomonas sp.]|nr:hypothetical protein [Roseateles sp.]
MSDKDGKNESFFRKVARFVANPTTDWAEINSRQDDPESDLAKAELRAMVERKRRNDFVRKRELDMLRRIRREGLSPEQLAALGSSSRLDEMERNGVSSGLNSKINPRVTDKINEIEQQMVGDSYAPTQHVSPATRSGYFDTSTRPAHFAATSTQEPPQAQERDPGRVSEFASRAEKERLETAPSPAAMTMGAGTSPLSDAKPSVLPPIRELPPLDVGPIDFGLSQQPAAAPSPAARPAPQPAPSPPMFAPPAPAPLDFASAPTEPMGLDAMRIAMPAPPAVNPLSAGQFEHDPELDDAVIAFANADYETTEQQIAQMIQSAGLRHDSSETWLAMFDLYRATGQQAKFEALAPEYVQQFARSAPQWFSMPKLVAEAIKNVRVPMGRAGGISWAAPESLTAESVQYLKTRAQNLPMPWVLDWSALRQVDPQACSALRDLFHDWASQQVDLRWLAGDQFLQLLKDATPVLVRDVDPAAWMLRLEALRLVNRADQFDEAAIDYCVTYEVSPPSWERARCRVRVSGLALSTGAPMTTTLQPTESPSTFLESTMTDQGGMANTVQLELSGQLSGDISETLKLMDQELGAATLVSVACPKLMRLDFMAAGDLLNWVIKCRGENRAVTFTDAHRLVAQFFCAMGINEHARIRVRVN